MLSFLIVLSQTVENFVSKLFADLSEKMYRLSLGILHSRNLAEDAVQEAFLRIIKHSDRIIQLPCKEQEPYCIIIVKNIAYDIWRKEKRSLQSDDIEVLAKELSGNAEDDFFKLDDEQILYRLLDKIPLDDKHLLMMKWGNQMSYREIGKVLEISEQAATKRGQRALLKMRNAFLKEGYGK